MHPSPQSNFFSIFMQFPAKIIPNIRLAPRPWGWCPREILDPPLTYNVYLIDLPEQLAISITRTFLNLCGQT